MAVTKHVMTSHTRRRERCYTNKGQLPLLVAEDAAPLVGVLLERTLTRLAHLVFTARADLA